MATRPATVYVMWCDAGTDANPCEAWQLPDPADYRDPTLTGGHPILAGQMYAMRAGHRTGWLTYPVASDWFDLCPVHAPCTA